MLIGKVISNVWSTRKEESLVGLKFMIVELEDTAQHRQIVAVDMIGAGIGERVLISQGNSARRMPGLESAPVDASIIGIIDEVEKDRS